MSSPIITDDLNYIYKNLGNLKKFKNKNILITGCAGIVGFYLSSFFKKYKNKLGIRKIIGVDNNSYKSSPWTKGIFNQKNVIFLKKDINKINFKKEKHLKKIDYIFHMATVASPYYFNKNPINVFNTNCMAYQNMLEFYKNKKISILYFSTSELYGTPEKNTLSNGRAINVPFVGKLRDYQETIIKNWMSGTKKHGCGLIEADYGAGKTVLATKIISMLQKKTLII